MVQRYKLLGMLARYKCGGAYDTFLRKRDTLMILLTIFSEKYHCYYVSVYQYVIRNFLAKNDTMILYLRNFFTCVDFFNGLCK